MQRTGSQNKELFGLNQNVWVPGLRNPGLAKAGSKKSLVCFLPTWVMEHSRLAANSFGRGDVFSHKFPPVVHLFMCFFVCVCVLCLFCEIWNTSRVWFLDHPHKRIKHHMKDSYLLGVFLVLFSYNSFLLWMIRKDICFCIRGTYG